MNDLKKILIDAERMYRDAADISPCSGNVEAQYYKALRNPLSDMSVQELNRRAEMCRKLREDA